ncbi:unnamed protein product [Protopolystoma xenopodis]|uniref:Uncharacterized protein n=1 Tax=Protopolystoma xenopodis TaxID=117903 RepID=A0A3S5B4N5_9PLAT|nr:unnamed protein product [Protopolystoma xenopodis]
MTPERESLTRLDLSSHKHIFLLTSRSLLSGQFLLVFLAVGVPATSWPIVSTTNSIDLSNTIGILTSGVDANIRPVLDLNEQIVEAMLEKVANRSGNGRTNQFRKLTIVDDANATTWDYFMELRRQIGVELPGLGANYFVYQKRILGDSNVQRSKEPLDYDPKLGFNTAICLLGVIITVILLVAPYRLRVWCQERHMRLHSQTKRRHQIS